MSLLARAQHPCCARSGNTCPVPRYAKLEILVGNKKDGRSRLFYSSYIRNYAYTQSLARDSRISTAGNFLPSTNSRKAPPPVDTRSEEHTSELQSRGHLVCR